MSGQPEPQLLEIPGAEGISVDFLTNLLNQPAPLQGTPEAMQVPLQQVAGLGATEQTVQGLLSKYLGTSATGGEAYKLGMGELQKTLGGEFYDPRTSDFWKGYRDVSEMEQEKGVAAIRRRGQLGGGLYADPSRRIESEYVKGMGAQRLGMLGGLYETERGRKAGAVGQALGYAGLEETGKAGRIELGARVGAIPRQVKSQQYQAAYNQALGQAQSDYATAQQQSQNVYQQQMFPYTAQSAVAGALMPQWFVPGQDNTAVGMLGLLGSIIGGK